MPTQLECLPNELLVYVFMYFDASNLYHSFWGLNLRFNNVVRSLKCFSLVIEKCDLPFMSMFAQQITQLKINTRRCINLSTFSNVNSLELCQASKEHLRQISADKMPNLVYLRILNHSQISLPLNLMEEIFSNAFPYLRHVHLSRLDNFEHFSQCKSPSLRTLHIACTDPNVIPLSLQTCPNLRSFHVSFLGENANIPPPASSSYDHVLEKFFLDDSYHKLSFDTLCALLLYVPNVEYLFLQFLCRVPFIKLAENILKHLKRLERFECDILECLNEAMVDVETIQCMNELFKYLECVDKKNGCRKFLL